MLTTTPHLPPLSPPFYLQQLRRPRMRRLLMAPQQQAPGTAMPINAMTSSQTTSSSVLVHWKQRETSARTSALIVFSLMQRLASFNGFTTFAGTPLISRRMKVAQAYQDSLVGSRAYKLRLLEMTAIACHDLAVHLFQQFGGLHKGYMLGSGSRQ